MDKAHAAASSAEAVAAAVAFVLRSTKARPQTEAELRAKLAARAYPDDVIDAAIDRTTALGAIDDVAFAKAWVNDRGRGGGYAGRRMRAEVRRRSLAEAMIDDAVGVLDERDDVAGATGLARERAQGMSAKLAPEAVARRLVGFLARRGYSEALAGRVAIDVSGLDRHWD